MKKGDQIRLRAFGGEVIERRVVAVEGDSVDICKDGEFEAAAREGRDPVTVAFKLTDVVGEGSGSLRSQRRNGTPRQ